MDGLGKELWRTVAILCLGTLVIGIFIGMLYQRWIDSPLQPLQPSAPTVQLAPPASPSTPQPNHKKSSQPAATGQVQ
jgi:hypothetical protein